MVDVNGVHGCFFFFFFFLKGAVGSENLVKVQIITGHGLKKLRHFIAVF